MSRQLPRSMPARTMVDNRFRPENQVLPKAHGQRVPPGLRAMVIGEYASGHAVQPHPGLIARGHIGEPPPGGQENFGDQVRYLVRRRGAYRGP
jgi:hypothetical protein